jgi:hypothetical protein
MQPHSAAVKYIAFQSLSLRLEEEQPIVQSRLFFVASAYLLYMGYSGVFDTVW